MKKLIQFQPEIVTSTFFPNISPEVINHGRCFQWAYFTYLLFEGVTLYDMECHAFVKHGNKFYDSERPKGELDWKDLPATNFGEGCRCYACKDGIHRHTPRSFRQEWLIQEQRFKLSWKSMEEQVKKFLNEYHNQTAL